VRAKLSRLMVAFLVAAMLAFGSSTAWASELCVGCGGGGGGGHHHHHHHHHIPIVPPPIEPPIVVPLPVP
jgi:hypothetical protein